MSERFEDDGMFNPQIRLQVWHGLLDAGAVCSLLQ